MQQPCTSMQQHSTSMQTTLHLASCVQAIPEPFRYGSQFVFRIGSPLDPAALRLVAASDAASVVLCR